MILMHTFSKAYGMAAARVGAAFCDPEIIRYFNKLKPPYNISTINQKAVLKKLGKNEDHLSEVDRIVKERERLCALLEKLEVVEKVYPSDANFFLVKVKNPRMVYSTLVEKEIIVRNRDSVIPGCMRITVGKPSENNRLIKELKSFIPHE
jgi:histidinol-phosphate aminotransferase